MPIPPDAVAPQVALAFPPAEASTDQPTIVVDGTASDDIGVAGVTVNGVDATSDDGFLTWRATVPLVRGANDLVAEARDAAGNTATDVESLERIDPIFVNPKGVEIDGARGRALVVDVNRLISVDLATGERVVLPLSGATLQNANRIALDDSGSLAFIGGGDVIYRVSLGTGETVALTGGGFGAGPSFSGVGGVRYDAASGDVIACSPGSRVTFRVDLASGNRTSLPFDLRGLNDFVLDPPRNRLIAGSRYLSAYDLDTMALTPISNPALGTGPDLLLLVHGQAIDVVNQILYATAGPLEADQEGPRRVIAWDLVSGDRRYLSGGGLGAGPDLLVPNAVALDAARGRLLVADAGLDALVAVDLETGDRSILSGVSKGSGPPLLGIRDMAAAADGRLFVLKDGGEILVLDGANRGAAPPAVGVKVTAPRSILFDEPTGRLVVSDLGGNVLVFNPAGYWDVDVRVPSLYSIDPLSGAATVVSDETHGNGPTFVNPDRIARDGDDAVVMDRGSKAIFRVDLLTGDRTVVSNQLVGVGEEFQEITALGVDGAASRALVSDVWTGVLSIDLLSGDRTRLTSARQDVADLTVDAALRRAFAANATQLLRIDLDAQVAQTLTGGGPRIVAPETVLFDPVRDVVLAGDSGTASIVAISPRTAERVILVK